MYIQITKYLTFNLRQWISGKQTLNVVVTLGITSSAENNIRDVIKFTASGKSQYNFC